MVRTIDLNSDIGEWSSHEAGHEAGSSSPRSEKLLIRQITSANIACGGHAGDDGSMIQVMKLCARCGVGIGAHPSYPDRMNFGRKDMDMTPDELAEAIHRQVSRLVELASGLGLEVRHVKPHGALYNRAAGDEATALAIVEGVARTGMRLAIFGLANSPTLGTYQKAGFQVIAEAFADRRYEPDGSLRSRRFDDSLITDPDRAAAQALAIAREGRVISVTGSPVLLDAQTICIHGDTPGSDAIAARIRCVLTDNGISASPFMFNF